MDASELVMADGEADPERCQSTNAVGQCRYKAVPGLKACRLHAGPQLARLEKKKIWNYNLTRYRARIEAFAENPEAKSLREEIGVLRMLLETTLNRCEDDVELLMATNKLSDLIQKIEKLVVSCHRIEERSGQLLDKTIVINLATSIINILSIHITDPVLLDTVGNQIMERFLVNAPATETIS